MRISFSDISAQPGLSREAPGCKPVAEGQAQLFRDLGVTVIPESQGEASNLIGRLRLTREGDR